MIVPLIGAGVKGKSAVVNAQRRINCYLEPEYDEDKTRLAVFGTPGLVQVADYGSNIIRGGLTEGELLYIGQGGVLYEVNNAFTKTDRNAASRFTTTTGRMSFASSGTVLAMVDGTNGYKYTPASTTFAQIASSMFASPKTVTWQDGYFLASFLETDTNAKRCQISADGTTWNALDFRAVETTPGALIRTFSHAGEVHQFTDSGIEFWAYTGDPTFPFSPIRGATLPVGLAARWSLAQGPASLFFLGRNRNKGQVQVFELVGHQLKTISTPDIGNLINAYSSKSDATGYCLTIDEHVFYVLSFPTAGVTWMYDSYASGVLGVPVWSELQSGNGRHRSDLAFALVDRQYVSDYANGKIYRPDTTTYDDNGAIQAFELDTRHFFKDFNRVTVDQIVADFETGIGLANGQGSDPQVMLQVSRDGGRTWGAELFHSLGAIGDFVPPISQNRLGTARDFVFKWRITDPVKRCLTGFSIKATPGA